LIVLGLAEISLYFRLERKNIMTTAIAKITVGAFGVTSTWDQTITADGGEPRSPDMIPAVSSVAWDYDTTTATMSAGHGLTTGMTVDVYWTDANGDTQYRYGCTVGTVSGETVPLTSGTGTTLPADDTVVTICEQISVALAFVGNKLEFGFATATYPSLLILTLDNAANVVYLLGPASGLLWFNGIGSANPYAGRSVASATVTTSQATGTGTINPITAGFVIDTTN
jgi:hypothetical protein